jgi:DNA-directed RNA polymerase I, II, and III subunit RPABC5
MIIPIRCFTCGNMLADKWRYYQRQVNEYRKRDGGQNGIVYLDTTTLPVTAESQALKDLNLRRYCCRKVLLTHVDLIDKI